MSHVAQKKNGEIKKRMEREKSVNSDDLHSSQLKCNAQIEGKKEETEEKNKNNNTMLLWSFVCRFHMSFGCCLMTSPSVKQI